MRNENISRGSEIFYLVCMTWLSSLLTVSLTICCRLEPRWLGSSSRQMEERLEIFHEM